MKTNLEYWQISLDNQESLSDEYYMRDEIIVEDENYRTLSQQLRDLITTYCTLLGNFNSNEDGLQAILDSLLDRIDRHLMSQSKLQYTEFVAFWKCLDFSYSIYKSFPRERRIEILGQCLAQYCERRQALYERLGCTHTIQQALYDNSAVRAQGTRGIEKLKVLLHTLSQGAIRETVDLQDLSSISLAYILPDKTKLELGSVLKHFGVEYLFGKDKQGKLPDLIVKISQHLFIIEAKHVKEPGGAQDKQIDELIKFISQSEKGNIHYVAFLDGLYFNLFLSPRKDTKQFRQREAIEQALRDYPQNFFVNTAGFSELFHDALQEASSA